MFFNLKGIIGGKVRDTIHFLTDNVRGSAGYKGSIPLHEEDAQPLKHVVQGFIILPSCMPGQLSSQLVQHPDGFWVPTPQGFNW